MRESIPISLIFLVGAPSVALGQECEPEWPDAIGNRECYVFGGDDELVENRAHRLETLELVEDGEYCVDLVYVNGWSNENDPEVIGFADVDLVDTFVLSGCESRALVEMAPEQEDVACEPGHYEVGVDDSLGPNGQILAILDGLVLVELAGELRYLLTADADPPACWRMIWHPPWRLAPPPSRGSSRSKPTRSPARNRRRAR